MMMMNDPKSKMLKPNHRTKTIYDIVSTTVVRLWQSIEVTRVALWIVLFVIAYLTNFYHNFKWGLQ